MRIASSGHALFSAILVALGLQGILQAEFPPVWEPAPKWLPARLFFIYLVSAISFACGAGLFFRRLAPHASRIFLASLLVWLFAFRVPPVVRAPASVLPWDGCAETLAIVAAAWVLCAWFVPATRPRILAATSGDRGTRIGRTLYALALVPFALAHFAFVKETASLVPAWLPAHVAWAYATGGAFLAAALGILAGVCARLAAALSAIEIGGFTLLVWGPVIAAGAKDRFQWSEFAISSALTAAGWVVADSYRGTRWLAVGER